MPKKTRQLEVPFTPPAPEAKQPMEGWGECPGCGRERRTHGGQLVPHRFWHTWQLSMLPCAGAGEVPTVVTT